MADFTMSTWTFYPVVDYGGDTDGQDTTTETLPAIENYGDNYVPGGSTYNKVWSMRAWNPLTLSFEEWKNTGTDPVLVPPSGNPVVGLTVSCSWEK